MSCTYETRIEQNIETEFVIAEIDDYDPDERYINEGIYAFPVEEIREFFDITEEGNLGKEMIEMVAERLAQCVQHQIGLETTNEGIDIIPLIDDEYFDETFFNARKAIDAALEGLRYNSAKRKR